MSKSSNSNKKGKNKKVVKKTNVDNIKNVNENELQDKKESDNKLDKKEKKSLGKEFDVTTKIRIDRDRLNDTGTLDVSFLENKKNAINKRKILVEEELIKKQQEKQEKRKRKNGIFKDLILLCFCICVLILSFYIVDKYSDNKCSNEKAKVKVKVKEVEKVVLDDNYLFLGDFLTDDYDLDENFENMFVVKSARKDDKVDDFLKSLDETVYKYNPSKVFIEIGLNDVLDDEDEEEIIKKLAELIDEIKENRSYAKIYLESIYPINNDKDDDLLENANDKIIKINEELLIMAEEKDIKYLDLYSVLVDEEGMLDEDYTDDGKSLNSEGYKTITEEIKKYINE